VKCWVPSNLRKVPYKIKDTLERDIVPIDVFEKLSEVSIKERPQFLALDPHANGLSHFVFLINIEKLVLQDQLELVLWQKRYHRVSDQIGKILADIKQYCRVYVLRLKVDLNHDLALVLLGPEVGELLDQGRSLRRANQGVHLWVRQLLTLADPDRADNGDKCMRWILCIGLLNLLLPSLNLLLREVLLVQPVVQGVDLVLYPTRNIGRQEKILLLKVVLRLLHLKGVIDHLYMDWECLFLHLEVADWQPPLAVLNEKRVTLSVEIAREALNPPDESRSDLILVLAVDDRLLMRDYLDPLLLEQLKDRITLPDLHERVKEQWAVIMEISSIKFNGSLDYLLDYGGLEDIQELAILLFDQVLNVWGCEVKGVAEKLEPKLLLLGVRGIRLKIIIVIVGRLFLIPASTEFIIGHLREEYDVFPVEHRH